MADRYAMVRKVMLPVPLLEKTERYFRANGETGCKARHLVDLCMGKLDAFNSLAVRVSGIRDYQNFLSTVFNRTTAAVTFFLKPAYWERVCRIQNEHNIGCGDIFRLILGSVLFDSGTIALPLEKLSRLFINERNAYTYNTLFTRQTAGLLREAEMNLLPMNREAVIRAAHCFFSVVPDALPSAIPEEPYRVDNGTTGWSRQTVSGSQELKAYLHRLKQSTGKSLSVLIAHTACSFIQLLREGLSDEKR